MGCTSSKTAPAQANKPGDPAAAGEPAKGAAANQKADLILTEATAEERALTQLKVIFDSIDANEDKDGSVCKSELKIALDKDTNLSILIKEAGFNEKFNVLEQLDSNHDGRVTWDEFHSNLKQAAVAEVLDHGNVTAVEKPADEKALESLKVIFEGLDVNHDHAVSKDELAAALKKDDTMVKLIEAAGFNSDYYILEQLDTNHDGRIVWSEFEEHLRGSGKEEVKNHGAMDAAVAFEEHTQTDEPVRRKHMLGCC